MEHINLTDEQQEQREETEEEEREKSLFEGLPFEGISNRYPDSKREDSSSFGDRNRCKVDVEAQSCIDAEQQLEAPRNAKATLLHWLPLLNNTKKMVGILITATLMLLIMFALVPLGWESRGILALSIFAVVFWTFEPAPIEYTSLAILVMLSLSSLLTFQETWLGASSEATWLVFAGMAISVAINDSVLSQLFARLTNYVGRGYFIRMAFLAVFGALLVPLIPSGVVRVILLMPMTKAVSEAMDVQDPVAKEGVTLVTVMTTLFSGTGILTAMTSNIIVSTITNIGWGTWAGRMALVYIISQPIIVVTVCYLFVIFKTRCCCTAQISPPYELLINQPEQIPLAPTAKPPQAEATWKEVKIGVILIIAVIFWATDDLHGIPPVQIGLGAALLCYFPGWGPVGFRKIGTMKFPLIIFVIAVLALGKSINCNSELRGYISDGLKWWVELTTIPALRYFMIALITIPFNFIMDSAAATAVVTPIFLDITKSLGLSDELVALSVAMGASIVFLPYQGVPYLIAYGFKQVKLAHFVFVMCAISILNIIIVIPLNITYWFLIDNTSPY